MWKNVFEKARSVRLMQLAARLGLDAGKSPCCGGPLRIRVDAKGCQRWSCGQCGYGGSAIDFAMSALKCDTGRAARAVVDLMNKYPELGLDETTSARQRADSVGRVLRGIVDAGYTDAAVVAYLEERGIRPGTVERAFDAGWVRSLPANAAAATAFLDERVGSVALRAAGVPWNGSSSALAYRPLVFLSADGLQAEFRSIHDASAGLQKAVQIGEYTLPIAVACGQPTTAIIVDGGLEVLSLLDIGFSRNVLIVGLQNRVWVPAWADILTARYPGVEDWRVATAPLPDDSRAAAMTDDLIAHGNFASRMLPPGGGDWNAALRHSL